MKGFARRVRQSGFLAGLLAVGLLAAGPVLAQDDDASEDKIAVADFRLKDLSGKQVSLHSRLKEGPVLISFWATWCKPCLQEMPHLDDINETWSERGLTTFAISIDKPRSQSKVRSYVNSKKFKFDVLLDPNEEAFRRMQGQSVPYVVLLKPDGEAQYVKVGYRPGDEKTLEAEIVKLLGEPEGEASEEGNTEEGES